MIQGELRGKSQGNGGELGGIQGECNTGGGRHFALVP